MDEIITCSFCDQNLNTVNPWHFLTLTLGQLDVGVGEGCQTCTLRKAAVSCFTSDPGINVVFQQNPDRFRLNRQFYEIFKTEKISASLSTPERFPHIHQGQLLSAATSSEQTFQTIRAWISDCSADHQICRARDDVPYIVPKRMLDLRFGAVVLREHATVDRYACLSHCWGRSQSPIKTLRDNIEQFKRDIPWSKLSKTFQDAVDVCRRVGIDYLWVDSLCIVQDSAEDWREQSVLMGQIYENAFLTIAATQSTDGTGGCYAVRDSGHVGGHPVLDESLYVRKEMPKVKFRYLDTDSLPLLSRGWVYQEMTLSRRVLHFCKQEVIWQCRACRKSESGSNDGEQDVWLAEKALEHSDRSWYDIVHNYTHLALTFEKDRLPALAAISQRAAKSRSPDDLFLAGLWMNTLLFDMLWQVCPSTSAEDHPTGRPTMHRSPSWSWASVKRRVQWFCIITTRVPLQPLPCTRVVDINVEPIGSPFLGHYSRSQIVLCAPLIKTTLKLLEEATHFYHPGAEPNIEIDGTITVSEFSLDYAMPDEGPDHIQLEDDLYILPITVQTGAYHAIYGLVLRLKASQPSYERVGLATLLYIKGCPPWRNRTPNEKRGYPATPQTFKYFEAYITGLPLFNITLE